MRKLAFARLSYKQARVQLVLANNSFARLSTCSPMHQKRFTIENAKHFRKSQKPKVFDTFNTLLSKVALVFFNQILF